MFQFEIILSQGICVLNEITVLFWVWRVMICSIFLFFSEEKFLASYKCCPWIWHLYGHAPRCTGNDSLFHFQNQRVNFRAWQTILALFWKTVKNQLEIGIGSLMDIENYFVNRWKNKEDNDRSKKYFSRLGCYFCNDVVAPANVSLKVFWPKSEIISHSSLEFQGLKTWTLSRDDYGIC